VGQPSADESGGPVRLTAAFGSIWMQVPNGGDLERIDPASGAITSIPTDQCDGQAEALGGSIWLSGGCSSVIIRVDPTTNRVVGRVLGPSGTTNPLAVDGASLWATTSNKVLLKVDPATGKVVGRWWQPAEAIFGNPALVACGDGSIWVSDSPRNRVLRLPP
jgi:streptogramin lyase